MDAHKKGIAEDRDAEALNLRQLVSNEDSETQAHLSQLDEVVNELRRTLGEIRHDEPVTIGTVLRSLLMANEPAQREHRKTFYGCCELLEYEAVVHERQQLFL